jgi:hypothetical protein
MTYNFDPDRWYQNELAMLKHRFASGVLRQAEFDQAVMDLDRRYDEMVANLDGTYQIPK